ncbi:MAG: prenyltransferase/squalene oxidase repeat-containing protein [Chloroflexota bacterium]
MDITKAINFIEDHGTDLEKARIRHILYGTRPDPYVIQHLLDLQNPEGGFPYDLTPGNISSVSDTLNALWQMDELGMLNSPAADNALQYLLSVQSEDGGWDKDADIAQYDPPPWAKPGSLAPRLYLSAYAAYWLALRGFKDHLSFKKALDFLRPYQDESGRFAGFPHTTWIATSVYYIAGGEYSPVAERGIRSLMEKPLIEWEDSQIAWALDCLSKAGFSKEHPFIQSCLEEIRQRQDANGCWVSEDGEAFTVGATLAALKVLKLYGLLPTGI